MTQVYFDYRAWTFNCPVCCRSKTEKDRMPLPDEFCKQCNEWLEMIE